MIANITNYSEAELKMSHADRIAWRKVGRIPGWEVCGWEVIDPDANERDVLFQGGVPRLLKSGKHKGQKTWRDSKINKVVVSEGEMKAEKDAYARVTGNCSKCMGSGEVMASWSSTEGIKMRPCAQCESTGKVAA